MERFPELSWSQDLFDLSTDKNLLLSLEQLLLFLLPLQDFDLEFTLKIDWLLFEF